MPLRCGRQQQQQQPVVARSLLLLLVLLLPSTALGYSHSSSSIHRTRITTAMAASHAKFGVVVVTGSNKGIGYEILKKVAPASRVAILAARNPQLGEAAAKHLREKDGLSNVVFKKLDIDSPDSIAAFARTMREEHGRVDVLVNNAGLAFKAKDPTPFRAQAGPTLKTNYWGTTGLIDVLTPLLRQSPDPRIVNVASQSGRLAILNTDRSKQREVSSAVLTRQRLDEMVREFQRDVEAGTHAVKGWPNTCYGMSKLALIAFGRVFAAEEATQHSEKPIWLASCCPGWCATDMSSHSGPRSAEHGARTPAWLALAGKEEGQRSGGFYQDEKEIAW